MATDLKKIEVITDARRKNINLNLTRGLYSSSVVFAVDLDVERANEIIKALKDAVELCSKDYVYTRTVSY